MKKENLIEWCFENLEFTNCPNDWTKTYIVDILNGYQGTCHSKDGKVYTYSQIRNMFVEED